MSLLTSVHQIEKTMGTQKLFQGLSFGIHQGQRIGLLGPNGSGKSTLLKILSGQESVDSGDVSSKRSLSVAYVPQDEVFEEAISVQAVAEKTLAEYGLAKDMAQVQAAIHLSMVGFENTEVIADTLSGGWRKRLSLAIAFAKEADLMLIDEPTNHLDWEGILWLENQLKTFSQAFIVVSHDREFLQNQCNQYMEINRLYKDGFFSLQCSYKEFLQKKDDYIAAQLSQQESMSNKARREVDWLRAGVKARTTKSSSRIKEAHQLLDDLSEVKQRNSSAKAKINIEIESGGKRSKKFIEAKNLDIAYGSHKILTDLNLLLGPRTRIGLLGDNASGKTSLLKVLSGLADNYTGELFRAEKLKVVYFDQKREGLDPTQNISEFLGDGSDHVEFQGRSLHVASYASQFLFDAQKMSRPIAKLSGGEQARLLIAKLLLQPADLLILDEPTNDLDIATIEMLENSLQEFAGLVLIVSHDRYFLNATCDRYLGLDGAGGWENYADLKQWLTDRAKSPSEKTAEPVSMSRKEGGKKSVSKTKLSFKEKRFLETIEADIDVAESDLKLAQESLDQNTNFSDHMVMQKLLEDLQLKQKIVDSLYSTWAEIEAKTK